jgi:hypothetical protein
MAHRCPTRRCAACAGGAHNDCRLTADSCRPSTAGRRRNSRWPVHGLDCWSQVGRRWGLGTVDMATSRRSVRAVGRPYTESREGRERGCRLRLPECDLRNRGQTGRGSTRRLLAESPADTHHGIALAAVGDAHSIAAKVTLERLRISSTTRTGGTYDRTDPEEGRKECCQGRTEAPQAAQAESEHPSGSEPQGGRPQGRATSIHQRLPRPALMLS